MKGKQIRVQVLDQCGQVRWERQVPPDTRLWQLIERVRSESPTRSLSHGGFRHIIRQQGASAQISRHHTVQEVLELSGIQPPLKLQLPTG